jgi:5-oxoprolinase (ATP-hydrolysing) subunit A
LRVDLNADLGEGCGHDRELLELVTSANVACGFHAGSRETMRAVCRAAVAIGVTVGAHPSFRDRKGFGRRGLDVAPHVVRGEVAEQLELLVDAARAEGASVTYLKPHGALYHRASVDPDCAAAIVDAARERGLAVLGWPGSELLEQARAAGLDAVAEGFADRGYGRDGALLPRSAAGAVLGPEEAAEQAVAVATGGAVRSICVHGDSPDAPVVARRVRASLVGAGFELRAFA